MSTGLQNDELPTTVPSTHGEGLLVETLLGVAASLNRSGDFESLLANILHGARAVMRCAACSISLPDVGSGDLLIHSTQRDWKKEGAWRLPKGQGIAGRVFETREAVNTSDAAKHPEHYRRTGQDSGLATQALLTIPLLDGEHCRGVMQAMNPEDREHFDGEDMRIFLAFGALVSVTLGRREAEEQAKARAVEEAERKVEMELARQVQETFLPEPRATHGPMRMQAYLEQATGIGGDCYFFHSPKPHLLLAGVGDVTGKGSSAALDMARLTTQIALTASQCVPEKFSAWLATLNNTLYQAMHAGDNAAALTVLLFDFENRRVQASTFAQAPPLFRSRENGTWQELACPRQPFFGQRRLTEGKVASMTLGSATHWLAQSDGILEAVVKDGSELGREGLLRILNDAAWHESTDIETLITKWRSLLRDGARDDATLLLLMDATPPPASRFEAVCTPQSIRDARKFCEGWLDFAGFGKDTKVQILVGCDEVLTNILKHAYGVDEPPGPITCVAAMEPAKLRFTFKHRGRGISQEEAAAQAHSGAREEGGMGLALVRRVFTHVHFHAAGSAGEESEITLEKELVG
jgi:serine phosphatase RsbU (regulator of sigma subunit)/anti-sigma regulatory factor (Ser/Thr protein kinase)